MIAVDTNILVRALTDDSSAVEQTALARKLIQQSGQVFVAQIVQVEFAWVLGCAYKLPKADLLAALETLLADDAYCLQEEDHFRKALKYFQSGNAGFADALIAVESQAKQLELWTFDRKLGNQPGVVRLTEQSLSDFE